MGDDQVVITDARIVERVEEGRKLDAPAMRVPEMVLWLVMSVLWYGVIRLVIVGMVALPWLIGGGHSHSAAASWAHLGLPLASMLAAFLTMQTHTRNRQLYAVMTFVVIASAFIFHIDFSLGNPFFAGANDAAAYVLQAFGVVAGTAAGFFLAKRRRDRRAAGQPALPSA